MILNSFRIAISLFSITLTASSCALLDSAGGNAAPTSDAETSDTVEDATDASDGEQPGYNTPEAKNPYRQIRGANKLVLSSEDYRDANGQLDVDAIQADFACMSLVGDTGDGFEKGLAASIHAVSPEMTGGTVETPLGNSASAPNHGLLRKDANFALIMITDENDCSDYGLFTGSDAFYGNDAEPIELSVDLETPCGDAVCAMWNNPDLSATTPTISKAYSGDRYDRFLREFNDDRVWPAPPETSGQSRPGLICNTTTLGPTLGDIALPIADAFE